MQKLQHPIDFQVIEFRRYIIKDGEREHFALYFDAYFPEAFQQLGAIAFGQFLEHEKSSQFTWMRGFHTLEDRAIVNAAFYYGPLWKEHKATMNSLMLDSDNVLLLRPLAGIPVLQAVDPVNEQPGARGIVVAVIFSLKPGNVDTFAKQVAASVAQIQVVGVRHAGVLVTLDVPNNFPQLPVRTDGPYLVYLAIIKDYQTWQNQFKPHVEDSLRSLTATGLLKDAPELIVMDPTQRSRLRWISDTHG